MVDATGSRAIPVAASAAVVALASVVVRSSD
jgi:hypothetical protein